MSAGRPPLVIGNRGVALVIVLWALTVISVIAANFTTANRDGLFLARNTVERAKAEALADAGVYRAILAMIRQEAEPGSDPDTEVAADGLAASLQSVRAGTQPDPNGEEEEQFGEFGPPTWRTDGTVYEWPIGDGVVSISIQDEGGKIDLNAATEDLLMRLFGALEPVDLQPEALVDRLIDYRDNDQERRPLGAEDVDYQRAGVAFGAKDRPFERIDELRRVLGVTPAIYRQIAPLITVHSGQRGVDPDVAPAGVLAILGAAGATVDTAPPPEPEPRTRARDDRLRDRANTAASRGRAFTITAEARTAGNGIFVRQAIVDLASRRGQPFIIRQWEQGLTRLNPDLGSAGSN